MSVPVSVPVSAHASRVVALATNDERAAFLNRVDQDADGGCWMWLGVVNGRGYGQWQFGDEPREAAHRVAYRLFVGPIPAKRHLHHTCGWKICVNPEHLEPLTHRMHMRMHARMRAAAAQG